VRYRPQYFSNTPGDLNMLGRQELPISANKKHPIDSFKTQINSKYPRGFRSSGF
jgi:hypothetical protein